jgi:hypothetical protein
MCHRSGVCQSWIVGIPSGRERFRIGSKVKIDALLNGVRSAPGSGHSIKHLLRESLNEAVGTTRLSAKYSKSSAPLALISISRSRAFRCRKLTALSESAESPVPTVAMIRSISSEERSSQGPACYRAPASTVFCAAVQLRRNRFRL